MDVEDLQCPSLDSPQTPSRLIALPVEITTAISSYLEVRDLIALSRCCRHLVPVATDQQIWTRLSIGLPRGFGEYPLIQPYPEIEYDDQEDEVQDPHFIWQLKEDECINGRREAALKEKVAALLQRGSPERWALVQGIDMVLRSASLIGSIHVLECAAATLTDLNLDVPDCSGERYCPHQPPLETLSFRLLGLKIHFPNLVRLRLGTGVLRYYGAIAWWCNAAPNLKNLDIDSGEHGSNYSELDGLSDFFPTRQADTLIETLRLEVDSSESCYSAMEALIRDSPRLQVLLLKESVGEQTTVIPLLEAARGKEDLATLSFQFYPEGPPALPILNEGFEALRRLVVPSETKLYTFMTGLALPNLEELYFNPSWEHEVEARDGMREQPDPYPEFGMLPEVAAQLLACPRLHTTHRFENRIRNLDVAFLAQIGRPGMSYVNSYRRGDDPRQLLVTRLLLDVIETSDRAILANDPNPSPTSSYHCYLSATGPVRMKVYEHLPEAIWQDFSDFGGHKVPKEVRERMREVEGASEESWTGRGIEVGEEAWRVLLEWYATL